MKNNIFDLIREQNENDRQKAKIHRDYQKEARKWMKEHPVEVAAVMEKHKNDPITTPEWILKDGELVSHVKNNLQF
jgi:hypothetical protein